MTTRCACAQMQTLKGIRAAATATLASATGTAADEDEAYVEDGVASAAVAPDAADCSAAAIFPRGSSPELFQC